MRNSLKNCLVTLSFAYMLCFLYTDAIIVANKADYIFMKLFRTSNIHVVSDCQKQFNFVLPSVQLARRAKNFANKLNVN